MERKIPPSSALGAKGAERKSQRKKRCAKEWKKEPTFLRTLSQTGQILVRRSHRRLLELFPSKLQSSLTFQKGHNLGDKEEDPELVEILTETAEPEPFNPPHPEKESSSTAPAEPEGNPATSASSSSGASLLLTAPNSDLRPRPSVVSTETRSSVGPATTRILIVSDFHGVIDTEEFLKFDRGRRGGDFRERPIEK